MAMLSGTVLWYITIRRGRFMTHDLLPSDGRMDLINFLIKILAQKWCSQVYSQLNTNTLSTKVSLFASPCLHLYSHLYTKQIDQQSE